MRHAEGRMYPTSGKVDSHGDVGAVELHLPDHAVAQVSQIPEEHGSGYLIRVWPPNGTHEYGGTNLTALSAVIRFDGDGKPIIDHFEAGER